jgi:hypothetical protein
MSVEDKDIIKVNKGALTVIRERQITCNIYKLLVTTVVGDVELSLIMLQPYCDTCFWAISASMRLWNFIRESYCVLGIQCHFRYKIKKHNILGIGVMCHC